MNMKKCCKCNEILPCSSFKSDKGKKDGLQSQCILCQKKYRRKHYLKNRLKYIKKASEWDAKERLWWSSYKKGFSCSVCGESHPACIDFHHERKDKEHNVSAMISNKSRIKVMAEIEKCIAICANCHRKLHYKDKSI